MESTEHNRVWHDGPPPHVGWWQASALGYEDHWRWWNGANWSAPACEQYTYEHVSECANSRTVTTSIRWNDYWPEDARVPRLAPEDFEVGARWLCVDPAFLWEHRGLEFVVQGVEPKGLVIKSHRGMLIKGFNTLPSQRYVPRRCVGQNTRWISALPEAPSHG